MLVLRDRSGRPVLAVLAALAVAVIAAAPSSGKSPEAAERTCARGSVHAVIAGSHRCLRPRQRCARKHDRQYHRYRFHCHSGRLVRFSTGRRQVGRFAVRGMYDRDSSATGFNDIASLGFNYIDSGPYPGELNPLRARRLKAFVWLGGYDNDDCAFVQSDAWVRSHVSAVAGHPAIGAYFIDNEPDPYACPRVFEQMRARARLVKSIDPRPPTHIMIDSNSGQQTLAQIPRWAGISDIVGLNPYPCYRGARCDYSWITTVTRAADAAGLRYWGQIQSFADDTWRAPTVDELHALYERWRRTKMEGYLVFAWRWPPGRPELWLANNEPLKRQHAVENAVRTTRGK